MTQFSLFGAAVAEPSLDDLDGILLAGGHWVRSGPRARLSVVVADRWRADSLAAEFALRGIADDKGGGDEPAVSPAESGFAARTAFRAELLPHADRWTRGANLVPPAGLVLTPGGLRLWALAAGRPDDVGYLLATSPAGYARIGGGTPTAPDGPVHLAGGAQLSRLGLAAVSIAYRGGPGWRVTSAKRIRRLAELLGAAPDGAEAAWPAVR
jgi:hypothetical protein